MFAKDFEKTVSATFHWSHADMLEIVEKFNEYHAEDNIGISQCGGDKLTWYGDATPYEFSFSDLFNACILWALWYPNEYQKFVKGMTWSNEGNMRGWKASEIIKTMDASFF